MERLKIIELKINGKIFFVFILFLLLGDCLKDKYPEEFENFDNKIENLGFFVSSVDSKLLSNDLNIKN